MNIYRVTNIDTGVYYIGNTEEVLDKLYINRDNLYWHVKNESPVGSWLVTKIGDDGLGNHRVSKTAKNQKRKDNILTFEDEIKLATQQGISYGQYKLKQSIEGDK